MIQIFSYPLGERSFHLFVDLKQAIVSVSGGLSPHNFEMCSISPQQACSFRCWFPNNSVITFLEGCFPSSFVAEVVIFFSILYSNDLSSIFFSFGGMVTLLSSLIISNCEDRVLFLLIHLTGVSCFHSSSLILSSFPSFLNWRAVWNPSYPLCHSFNSSGGSVLLISSSNIPSSQVHVLFLPCSTGVLPEFFPSHLVLTGVVSNSILSIKLLIHVFATFKFS